MELEVSLHSDRLSAPGMHTYPKDFEPGYSMLLHQLADLLTPLPVFAL